MIVVEEPIPSADKHICIQEPISNVQDQPGTLGGSGALSVPPVPSPNKRSKEPSRGSSRHSRLSYRSDSQLLFERRVSFDSMPDELPCCAHAFSLKHVSAGYTASSQRRMFMVAVDLDRGPLNAIQYTVEELLDDGDELVIVGIHSPRIAPREMAQQLMDWVTDVHRWESKISITVELSSNPAKMTITELVKMYDPSMLIVGFRRKSARKIGQPKARGLGIFKSSLQNIGVPVIYGDSSQMISRLIQQTAKAEPPAQRELSAQSEHTIRSNYDRHQTFAAGCKKLLAKIFSRVKLTKGIIK